MKHCNRSSECAYENAFEKDTCAYREDLHEYDLCPLLLYHWEEIIDALEECKKRSCYNEN